MARAIDRLRHELTALRDRLAEMIETEDADDRRDDDDFTAMVTAKLRPRPHRGSGAVALREPDDRYHM